jgi:hypothetical protein
LAASPSLAPDNIERLSSSVLTPGGAPIEGGGGASTATPGAATPGPVSATTAAPAAQSQATRAPWWIEVGVIVWLCWVYDAITNLAPLRLNLALAHAREILNLERSLHLDPELSLDRWLAGHHTLGLALSDYYDNAHFIVTLGLLGYLWWRRADIYRPLRNVLVLTNVLAFVVFWRYPVAPPRMLHGFTDVVAASGAFGSWHTGALASQANQLAAVPSLHMAWAGWCTLAVWRITARRWARALAVLYPCLTALAVLSTGNHFLLDILAGLLTLAVSVSIVWLATAWWRGPRRRGGLGRASTA